MLDIVYAPTVNPIPFKVPVVADVQIAPLSVEDEDVGAFNNKSCIKAVVAICVVLVVFIGVGASGMPIKVGESIGAAPKLVNASAAVVAAVPPFAIATTPETFAAVPVAVK